MKLRHTHAVFVHGSSAVHRIPAVVKLAALGAVVVAVVATPREQVWALVVEAAIVATVAILARLGPATFAKRLLVAAPFLVFALALPLVGSAPRVAIYGASLSVEGLWAAWSIFAKGLVCLAAAILMTATTGVPEIIEGLGRLRVPALIVGIASFMVRYLDVLAEESSRMRTAMAARGYAPRWLWQAAPTAGAASVMFVRSYERGERTYDAMVARGYAGEMPDLHRRAVAAREWTAGIVVGGATVLVALGAIVAGWGPGS
jgi:cobalt/nickel transport system permease protein